jgi:ABC-type polysaccharide/polyol phosphate transport system ATPase subunit
MFGLLPDKPGLFTEHAALDGLNVQIKKGERVALIGRNGAGKSTFLKLVTGVVSPTSGELDVNARVHALLQVGTGFHPDFTGRENVYAYLAQLGITGSAAHVRCAEAVEFAEVEEYIDQPVKTYSTGMAVRLMFAASTAISPDLLVLDEVLGVGDAYFSQKSFGRIQELCDKEGTTLLLVTHDIYSAAKLCERVIWIDRGTVMIDGDPTRVMKAYGESIRLQEEHRLRLKTQAVLQRAQPPVEQNAQPRRLVLELRGHGGRPQPSPIYFSRLALIRGDVSVDEVALDNDEFSQEGASHLVREEGCWGTFAEHHGRRSRPMLNYGSPFHKVVAVFRVAADTPIDELSLAVDYMSELPCRLTVTAYLDDETRPLGVLNTSPESWQTHVVRLADAQVSTTHAQVVEAAGVEGTGDIEITRFVMIDGDGNESHTAVHGEPVSFLTEYRIRRSDLRERSQVFIIVTRNHTERVCKFRTTALMFDSASQPCGAIEMRIPRMMLGAGTYSVAVEIAAENYLEQGPQKFFSIDERVYSCITHAYEFSVLDNGWIGPGTIFEGEGEWELKSIEAPA